MNLRQLGRADLELPPIVIGAMFRGIGPRNDALARTVDRAIELGLTAIDTAPLYDFGGSERLLGELLAGRLEKVTLLTKVGLRWDDDWGEILFETDGPEERRRVRRDSRPIAVRRDVEESLVRLGCETLDLVQVHHRDCETPIAETMGELLRLREEGKLRAIGVSNYTMDEVLEADRALGDVPLASTQEQLSLLGAAIDPARLAQEQIGLLAFSPLARGLLGGRGLSAPLGAGDGRHGDPLFQPRNLAAVRPAFDGVLAPIAEAHRATPAQVALAWLVAEPGVTAAIAGVQTPEQVEDVTGALEVELSDGEQDRLRDAFSAIELDLSLRRSLDRRVRDRLGRIARRIRRRLA